MEQNLTEKQLKFIDTYLNSKTLTECCKKLNITRGTGYNYLKDDNVKLELNIRRSELMSDTTKYLQNQLIECSKTLMEIIQSSNTTPQVKINAINSIFNNCNKLTETNDILIKISELEQRISDQEGNNEL